GNGQHGRVDDRGGDWGAAVRAVGGPTRQGGGVGGESVGGYHLQRRLHRVRVHRVRGQRGGGDRHRDRQLLPQQFGKKSVTPTVQVNQIQVVQQVIGVRLRHPHPRPVCC